MSGRSEHFTNDFTDGIYRGNIFFRKIHCNLPIEIYRQYFHLYLSIF